MERREHPPMRENEVEKSPLDTVHFHALSWEESHDGVWQTHAKAFEQLLPELDAIFRVSYEQGDPSRIEIYRLVLESREGDAQIYAKVTFKDSAMPPTVEITSVDDGWGFQLLQQLGRETRDRLIASIRSLAERGKKSNAYTGAVERDIEATVDMKRNDPHNDFPPKLGRQLHQKAIAFIRHMARAQQEPIRHLLLKTTDMPNETWHQVFDPVIEQFGYEPILEDGDPVEKWEKIYKR